MGAVVYPRLAVIGCGLIGSSVIRAARAAGAVETVAVADASAENRALIEALGYADLVVADPAEAVRDADLILIATPPSAIGQAARDAAPAMKPGATLTDVGSVKHAVMQALSAAAPEGVHVIPATRSPAPSSPARPRASPSCSPTAGPCSARPKARITRRSTG